MVHHPFDNNFRGNDTDMIPPAITETSIESLPRYIYEQYFVYGNLFPQNPAIINSNVERVLAIASALHKIINTKTRFGWINKVKKELQTANVSKSQQKLDLRVLHRICKEIHGVPCKQMRRRPPPMSPASPNPPTPQRLPEDDSYESDSVKSTTTTDSFDESTGDETGEEDDSSDPDWTPPVIRRHVDVDKLRLRRVLFMRPVLAMARAVVNNVSDDLLPRLERAGTNVPRVSRAVSRLRETRLQLCRCIESYVEKYERAEIESRSTPLARRMYNMQHGEVVYATKDQKIAYVFLKQESSSPNDAAAAAYVFDRQQDVIDAVRAVGAVVQDPETWKLKIETPSKAKLKPNSSLGAIIQASAKRTFTDFVSTMERDPTVAERRRIARDPFSECTTSVIVAGRELGTYRIEQLRRNALGPDAMNHYRQQRELEEVDAYELEVE